MMTIDWLLLIATIAAGVLILVGFVAYLARNKKPKPAPQLEPDPRRRHPLAEIRDWEEYVPPNDCIEHTVTALGQCICGVTVTVQHHVLQVTE